MQEGTAMPSPPRLHWGWVLAICIVTLGVFAAVWMLVQSNWSRKVRGRSRAFVMGIIYWITIPVGMLLVFMFALVGGFMHIDIQPGIEMLTMGMKLILYVLPVIWAFTLRSELEADPIGMSLSGVMTFFFASIYFQYHLFDFEAVEGRGEWDGTLGLSSSGPASQATENL